MKTFSFFITVLVGILLSTSAHAEIKERLKAELINAGLSPRAVQIMNQKIKKTHYARRVVGIVDYTLPSTSPRFFLIDLRTGHFDAYRVSHGVRSGGLTATAFSNIPDSNQSSLGFIRTDVERSGAFGRSLMLVGISPSNSKLSQRAIILHSAEYASDRFQRKHGFFGRSFGCLTVSQKAVDAIIDRLGSGSLILAYHDKLWDQAQTNPREQTLSESGQIPPPTEWEALENSNGDPVPHKRGAAPSSDFKMLFENQSTPSVDVQGERALVQKLSQFDDAFDALSTKRDDCSSSPPHVESIPDSAPVPGVSKE